MEHQISTIEQINATADDWDRNLERLSRKIRVLGKRSAEVGEGVLSRLDARQREVRKWINEARLNPAHSWNDIEEGFRAAWQDLEAAYRRARREWRTKT